MRGFIAGMSVHKSVSSAWQGPVRRIAREVGSGTNVDERLKAARERREEQQRLLASRVHNRYEREQRAKLHYEQQLQERQKKLQEQKRKEDRRRAAVEEKRLQYLKEEKERNESAVRRTKEKSQRAQQKSSQNVSGRKPTKNAPRHIALSTWEKNLVSRLLTPTSSFLARSKSAADQSGEEVSFYSTTSSSLSSTPQLVQDHRPNIQKPQNQRPQDKKLVTQRPQNQKLQIQKTQNQRPKEQKPQTQRPQVQRLENQKPQAQRPQMKKTQNLRPQSQRPPPHLSPSVTHSKSTSSVKPKAVTPHNAIKKTSNAGPDKRSPVKNNVSTKTSRTTSSPSPERVHRRSSRRHSIPLQLDLESVPEEDVPICNSALSPGNSRPGRPVIEDRMEDSPETQSSGIEVESRTAGDGSPSIMLSPPSESMLRPSSGTTDPEEASRLLAERRREARQLRELEEQKRLEAAEAERRSHEALERHRAEERARQQAEAEHLIAEKQRREEEESKKAEEERLQAMREAALLHKQREEEQAREREKAAQIQKERELYAQKEEAERQVRKKRLEEIMRRTRGTVSPDMKSATVSILPNENTEPPVQDAVKPPSSRPSQIVVDDKGANDDMVPVVAFKERRSLRTLTGLEDIQTHQRAEVI
ncbi:ensconsin-like isoform X2 [Corythoichthys intestinalis]|uniref:ensconsin-like isoform X2 n=1 Tax=Corythoichthys intestinalis TaxID=161448 RepID=UPI0025A54513|nr:ensconsin-like isoform X2 [Corythoichthys intestinalis]